MPSSIYVCQLTTKNILAVVFELTLIQLETERFLIFISNKSSCSTKLAINFDQIHFIFTYLKINKNPILNPYHSVYLFAQVGLSSAYRLRVRAYIPVTSTILLTRQIINLKRVVATRRQIDAVLARGIEPGQVVVAVQEHAVQGPVLHVVLEPPVQICELSQEWLHERDQLRARDYILVEQSQTLEEVVVNLLGAQGLFQPFKERHLIQAIRGLLL